MQYIYVWDNDGVSSEHLIPELCGSHRSGLSYRVYIIEGYDMTEQAHELITFEDLNLCS